MNIKNASQRVISNEAYVNTKADVSKVSEAGKNLVKDSFENTKTSDSDQGKKKLTFDQERLAATANYNNVGDNASQMIDARSRAQNPPTDKNPYGPGVKGDRKDPLSELRNKINDQRQQVREGSKEPTGPNIGPKIDQLVSGEVTVETEGSRKAKEDRQNLRDGGSGGALLASASEQQNNSAVKDKGMISQSGGVGYGGVGYKEGEGVKGGSNNAAKNNPGLNEVVKQTYVNGGAGSTRELGLLMGDENFNPNDYTRSDGTRVQTGKDGTVVETAKDGTKTVTKPDGSSTTVKPDGSYEDKDKDGKTTDKGGVKMPDEDHQYVTPNMPGFVAPTAGGVVHKNGSGDGGNIDPDREAVAKGPVFNDAQVHLQEIGKYGMIGQPDENFNGGNGPSMSGTGQQGADIDFGPDSTSPGYTGNTKAQEPGDVNFDVGGQGLIGVESKEEEKKTEEKESRLRSMLYRRIQA
jgi:hypothetical protein